jgi:hypothetical protein
MGRIVQVDQYGVGAQNAYPWHLSNPRNLNGCPDNEAQSTALKRLTLDIEVTSRN